MPSRKVAESLGRFPATLLGLKAAIAYLSVLQCLGSYVPEAVGKPSVGAPFVAKRQSCHGSGPWCVAGLDHDLEFTVVLLVATRALERDLEAQHRFRP